MNSHHGFTFDGNVQRIVELAYYDGQGSNKVYHLVMTELSMAQAKNPILAASGNRWQVYGLYGRKGSSLRKIEKTSGPTSSYSAQIVFDQAMNKEIKGGYVVQRDERISENQDVIHEYDIDSDGSVKIVDEPKVWSPKQYALSPVRNHKENEDRDMSGCGIILLNEGKRILTLVEGSHKGFYDQHGNVTPVDESLIEATIDLEGEFLLDGHWDGTNYYVYDVPGEQQYIDRYNSIAEILDGTVGDNVIPANLYLTPGEIVEAIRQARDNNILHILGIRLDSPARPGLNDNRRFLITLKPRVTLCVLSVGPRNLCSLGVDDGLGMIEVCQLTIEDVEVNDHVCVEYDVWPGYGKPLADPVYLGKSSSEEECKIEQLLAV